MVEYVVEQKYCSFFFFFFFLERKSQAVFIWFPACASLNGYRAGVSSALQWLYVNARERPRVCSVLLCYWLYETRVCGRVSVCLCVCVCVCVSARVCVDSGVLAVTASYGHLLWINKCSIQTASLCVMMWTWCFPSSSRGQHMTELQQSAVSGGHLHSPLTLTLSLSQVFSFYLAV